MKKLYLYLLFFLSLPLTAGTQTLVWWNLFEEHSEIASAGRSPNSLIDSEGNIITVVIEHDTMQFYRMSPEGVVKGYLNTRIRSWDYTPLTRIGDNELAIVFKRQSGQDIFTYLQLDENLHVVREAELSIPLPFKATRVQHLTVSGGQLFLTALSGADQYLFRIMEDDSLSMIYSGKVPSLFGEELIVMDNGNFLFSYVHANEHILRCISPADGTVVWERSVYTGYGIALNYKVIKNQDILYVANLERAWEDGIARDRFGITHLDADTGDILFQTPLVLPYTDGCFVKFNDFAYNPVHNLLYVCYSSCFPEAAISIAAIDMQAQNIVRQAYFPMVYDVNDSHLTEDALLHVREGGDPVILYKSFKDDVEKINLFISPLTAALESRGKLEVNFIPRSGSEHVTDLRMYDDSKLLVTGIVPDPDPNISFEKVRYFTAMIDVDGALSSEGAVRGNREQLMLYPNPVTEDLTIRFPEEGIYRLTVFNSSGQIFYAEKRISGESLQLAVNSYPPGIYFVLLSGKRGMLNGVFAVKK